MQDLASQSQFWDLASAVSCHRIIVSSYHRIISSPCSYRPYTLYSDYILFFILLIVLLLSSITIIIHFQYYTYVHIRIVYTNAHDIAEEWKR